MLVLLSIYKRREINRTDSVCFIVVIMMFEGDSHDEGEGFQDAEESMASGQHVKHDRRLPIRRLKLDANVSVQLEHGFKLTLSCTFPPTCYCPAPNVQIFHAGLQRLLDKWEEIYMALCMNHHYTCCLEQSADIEENHIHYVLVEVDASQQVYFYHSFIKRQSGSWLSATAPANNYRPAYTQVVSVQKASFERLFHFLQSHVSDGVKVDPSWTLIQPS